VPPSRNGRVVLAYRNAICAIALLRWAERKSRALKACGRGDTGNAESSCDSSWVAFSRRTKIVTNRDKRQPGSGR